MGDFQRKFLNQKFDTFFNEIDDLEKSRQVWKVFMDFPGRKFVVSVLRESQRNQGKCIQRSCLHFPKRLFVEEMALKLHLVHKLGNNQV